MTDDEALRLAASHWLERLDDGETSLDYPGQAEQLVRILRGVREPFGARDE